MRPAEIRLYEAEVVARELEAVLEAAARMVGPYGSPDGERAAWLHAVALDLSQRLILVIKGTNASEGASNAIRK